MADQINGLLSPFLRTQRITAAMPYFEGRILDFGCGIGHLADLVPADRYVGTDIDKESIQIARKRFPVHSFFSVDEFEAEGLFDSIISLAVIEHVANPEELMNYFTRMLLPGGRIVLTTPNPHYDIFHNAGAHFGLFSKEGHDEHQSLMDKAGLQELAAKCDLTLTLYRRFLFGANQLAVYETPGSVSGNIG